MYVTVESGITWKALHEALSKTDVRTPFGVHYQEQEQL